MFFRRKAWAVTVVGGLVGLVSGYVQAGAPVKERAVGTVARPSKSKESSSPKISQAPVSQSGKLAAAKSMGPVTMKIHPAKTVVIPPPSAREPVLLPVAIEDQPASARPVKAVPLRVYALDGNSFYQNGLLIKILGLPEANVGGEHAKQRLQQTLDSGVVTVLPVGSGPRGEMVADVRVNGRNVVEVLASQN